MKKLFCAFAAFCSLYAGDPDQQLLDCIYSTEFVNTTVMYPFEGVEYPIRVIHNPGSQILWGPGLDKPTSLSLMVIANLPRPLARHLEELVPELEDIDPTHEVDLRGYYAPEGFAAFQPVYVATTISDYMQDEAIRRDFQSATFVNKVYCYYIDNAFYRVRVLFNPDRLEHKAKKKVRLAGETFERVMQVTWDSKYGIFTDVRAPTELIEHIKGLTEASYWDWYFNINICSGTYVRYSEAEYYYTTSWELDTWFNFAEDF